MIKRVLLNTATNNYTVFLNNGERYVISMCEAKEDVIKFCLNAGRVMESGDSIVYVIK